MVMNILLIALAVLIFMCVKMFWWETFPGGKYIKSFGVIIISSVFIYGSVWLVNKATADSSNIDIAKFNSRER